jgi:uncharacterized protein YcnI
VKNARILLIAVAALLFVPAAAAHVTANPASGPAGGFAMIAFRVPHGCEESPTTSLTIQIPAGVGSVAPQAVPGWKVTTKEGTLPEPIESEGETITEGVTEVTWSGGSLSPHQFTDFGLSLQLPDTAGETVYFPVVQRCKEGLTRWIQIPVEGEPEPDAPAPGVELVASSGDEHGGGGDDAMAGDETATTTTEEASDDEDDDMSGAELAAVGMGAGGLVAGVAGLVVATRRRPRT